MTATVFSLSVGLFSLVGFAVLALSSSVGSSPAQDAALLTAVGLASPARAAYTKEASAPTTLNPEQNGNLSRLPTWSLQPVGGSIKMKVVLRASDLFGGSWWKGSEIAAPSLASHTPMNSANNADLRHFTLNPFFFSLGFGLNSTGGSVPPVCSDKSPGLFPQFRTKEGGIRGQGKHIFPMDVIRRRGNGGRVAAGYFACAKGGVAGYAGYDHAT
jgi:hypothetical protein